MDVPFTITEKTYDAIQTLFVGTIPTPERCGPTRRCLSDFFSNLWDNKGTLLTGALAGGLALIIHYTVDQPLPTGILIGAGATLVIVGICNSFQLRPPRFLARDSNASSYLMNPSHNSLSCGEPEAVDVGKSKAAYYTYSVSSSPNIVDQSRTIQDPYPIRMLPEITCAVIEEESV